MNAEALVVLSGGQDSTTCLYWALDKFGSDAVESITFDYGQRHKVELECATAVADLAGVPNKILPIDTFEALGGNALTDKGIDVLDDIDAKTNLPNTFVPGRNIVFLTFAAAYAWRKQIRNLVTGVAQTDYSGYPDCRQETLDALQATLRLGMESDVIIHAPLMNLSKKDTVLLAQDLGALEAMALTHTCYLGLRPPCGHCQACQLRARGFRDAAIEDPLTSALLTLSRKSVTRCRVKARKRDVLPFSCDSPVATCGRAVKKIVSELFAGFVTRSLLEPTGREEENSKRRKRWHLLSLRTGRPAAVSTTRTLSAPAANPCCNSTIS